jgi:hypothetical protein
MKAFFRSWHEFQNPVAVKVGVLHSQTFKNRNFHCSLLWKREPSKHCFSGPKNVSPGVHGQDCPEVPSRTNVTTLVPSVLKGRISWQMLRSLRANCFTYSSQQFGEGVWFDCCAPRYEFNVNDSSIPEYRCHNFPEDRHNLNFLAVAETGCFQCIPIWGIKMHSCLIACHCGFQEVLSFKS